MNRENSTAARQTHSKSGFGQLLHHRATAWWILALLLVLTAIAGYITYNSVQEQAVTRFQYQTDEIATSVQRRLRTQQRLLYSAAGLFAASKSVERDEWRGFVQALKLKENYPGLQGLGYAAVFPPSEKNAVVASVRAEGFPQFQIRPEGERDIYSTILYLEPFEGRNLRAFGYDMLSEPIRREAMERARDSGESTLTNKLTLVQETERNVQNGFLIYLPIYHKGMPIDTVEHRRAALQGFVYSPFRVNDFIKGIEGAHRPLIDVDIYDNGIADQANLLYQSENHFAYSSTFYRDRVLSFGGHVWTLVFHSPTEFIPTEEYIEIAVTVIGGLVIDALLFTVFFSIARRRQQAETLAMSMTQESRASEARMRAIMNNVVDGIITTDEHGVIESVNTAAEQIFGYKKQELIGNNVTRLIPENYRSRHNEALAKYITKSGASTSVNRELEGLHKNGHIFPVDIAISELRLGEKRLLIGILRDITSRRQAEQAVRESEERHRLTLICADLATWDWDIPASKFKFNERWASMRGRPIASLETHIDVWQSGIHPEDLPRFADKLADHFAGGNSLFEAQYRVMNQRGDWLWVLCRGAIIGRDAKGTPLRMAGTEMDISVSKQAEEELIEARDEARQASRAKTEFLSSMSHELRTPMNAILGFAQLMSFDQAIPFDQKENVQEILKAGRHLLDLINEVLDLAKVESGKVLLSMEPVALNPLLRECLTLVATLAEKQHIRLLYPTQDDLQVFADRTRLRQVILNLLSNAIKYNREGGSVTITTQCDDHTVCRIQIIDTGKGIAGERIDQLFQPFNRLGAESTDIEGTGIGLTITRRLVELMGGSVGVESKLDIGSTFWITVPCATPSQSQLEQNTASPVVSRMSTHKTKHTVLYIEDNPANLRLVEQILGKREGLRLLTAHNAELGIELVLAQQPDLILLDINMPGMDGYDVLNAIKQNPRTQNTPVVAVTANAMPDDIARGEAAGFAAYLTKPLDVPRFVATVERLVGNG